MGGPLPAGQPGVAGGPAAPRPRRAASSLLLGVATVVFLIAAAVFGVLYFNEHSAHNRTQQERQSQVESMQRDLEAATSKLETVQQNESQLQSRVANLEKTNADLKKCNDAVDAFLAALNANDQPRGQQAAVNMFAAC